MNSALPASPASAPAPPEAESSVLRRLVPWLLVGSGLAGLCAEVVLGRSLALSLGSSGSAQAGEAALRAALGDADELPMAQRTLLEALPAAATETADDEARARCRLLRRGGLLAPPGPFGGGATGLTIEGWRARCSGLSRR